LREAFAVAEREWRRSTDLDRSLLVLVDLLDDPVADAVAETLLVAHEVGGSGLDLRLTALAADRRQDLRARADASARLAGARFARWFVLAVPAGMALAGLAIGDGRAAYATPTGQVGLVMGVAVVGVCWFWAEHLMQAPAEPRVIRR
jgi:tight adherence protein B